MILSKMDLLPHVDFDVDKVVQRALRINPDLEVLRVSARDGTGIQEWCDWIVNRTAQLRRREPVQTDNGRLAQSG